MKEAIGRWNGLVSLTMGSMALALVCAQAVAAPARAEKGLLGVRVLAPYRTVLAKYGQPDAIYRYGEDVNMVMAVDALGSYTGGVLSLGLTDTYAATPAAARGGASQFGGRQSMGGSQSTLGEANHHGRDTGDASPLGGRGMSALPNLGGSRGLLGSGSSALPGSPGVGVQADNGTFASAGGFIWVYFFPKKELIYQFFFNADGRVEGILERGRYLGMPTSRGVGLSASVRRVYETYGWPDSSEIQGPSLQLNFNERYHVYFSLLNNKVTGIAVFLRESEQVHFFNSGTTSAGSAMPMSTGKLGGGLPGFSGNASLFGGGGFRSTGGMPQGFGGPGGFSPGAGGIRTPNHGKDD